MNPTKKHVEDSHSEQDSLHVNHAKKDTKDPWFNPHESCRQGCQRTFRWMRFIMCESYRGGCRRPFLWMKLTPLESNQEECWIYTFLVHEIHSMWILPRMMLKLHLLGYWDSLYVNLTYKNNKVTPWWTKLTPCEPNRVGC